MSRGYAIPRDVEPGKFCGAVCQKKTNQMKQRRVRRMNLATFDKRRKRTSLIRNVAGDMEVVGTVAAWPRGDDVRMLEHIGDPEDQGWLWDWEKKWPWLAERVTRVLVRLGRE